MRTLICGRWRKAHVSLLLTAPGGHILGRVALTVCSWAVRGYSATNPQATEEPPILWNFCVVCLSSPVTVPPHFFDNVRSPL